MVDNFGQELKAANMQYQQIESKSECFYHSLILDVALGLNLKNYIFVVNGQANMKRIQVQALSDKEDQG